MKRIFLLLSVVLGLMATKVNAQRVPDRNKNDNLIKADLQNNPIRFGVRVGANLTDWRGESMKGLQDLVELSDGSASTKMKEGIHAGVYISIPVGPGFEIEPGLQYSQKGMRLEGKIPYEKAEFLNATVTVTNKSEYLELPIVAKLFIGEGFHIYGGPQVAYLLSNKVQVEAKALGYNVLNREWDVKDRFREFDLSLAGGVGYRFNNGLTMSAGYDHGLEKVDKKGNFEAYNRAFKASVGYSF
jgi:hypothetical protein